MIVSPSCGSAVITTAMVIMAGSRGAAVTIVMADRSYAVTIVMAIRSSAVRIIVTPIAISAMVKNMNDFVITDVSLNCTSYHETFSC